jgi:peptidyl-prolyl cis-trans isomerase C
MMKRNCFKFVLSMVFVLALATFAFPSEGGPSPAQHAKDGHAAGKEKGNSGEAVIAKVNGVAITRGSLETMTKMLEAEEQRDESAAGTNGTGRHVRKDMRKDALNKLILSELMYQRAVSEGLKATQEEIDDAVATVRTNLGGEEEYKKFLEGEHITDNDVRAQIARSSAIKAVLEKDVFSNISVSEGDMKKQYEMDKAQYTTPEKIVVDDVVFFLKVNDANSLKKAQEILKKIKDDPERDPQSLVPDGTFAVRDLVVREDREKVLYQAAKGLKTGELSGVLITPDSLHIIKLKEYTPFKQFTFDEVKGAVLKKLKRQAREERLEEWGKKLRKEARIEIVDPELAREMGNE